MENTFFSSSDFQKIVDRFCLEFQGEGRVRFDVHTDQGLFSLSVLIDEVNRHDNYIDGYVESTDCWYRVIDCSMSLDGADDFWDDEIYDEICDETEQFGH